jgi:hypothetical protein
MDAGKLGNLGGHELPVTCDSLAAWLDKCHEVRGCAGACAGERSAIVIEGQGFAGR